MVETIAESVDEQVSGSENPMIVYNVFALDRIATSR